MLDAARPLKFPNPPTPQRRTFPSCLSRIVSLHRALEPLHLIVPMSSNFAPGCDLLEQATSADPAAAQGVSEEPLAESPSRVFSPGWEDTEQATESQHLHPCADKLWKYLEKRPWLSDLGKESFEVFL